jgi:hypothetical protein
VEDILKDRAKIIDERICNKLLNDLGGGEKY